MAQEFAKSFYRSAKWRKLRDVYIKSVFGLCEECGRPGYIVHHKILLTPWNISDPDVALNPTNLIYLCKECHEKEHHSGFDADGRPVPENYWRDGEAPR